ncbi:hypothetical protein HID58_054072 [Brassica napus]|uniref:Uncharacterized protein n=1 Tax=Brassica napus TaxID=3708 RepID=A0ABQ8AGU0_BRANA|nr:hypothetical protein HID58_054072 [Brassica napus]
MCDRTYPLSQVACTLILFDGEKIPDTKKNLLVPSLMVCSYGSILQTSTDTSYAETCGTRLTSFAGVKLNGLSCFFQLLLSQTLPVASVARHHQSETLNSGGIKNTSTT